MKANRHLRSSLAIAAVVAAMFAASCAERRIIPPPTPTATPTPTPAPPPRPAVDWRQAPITPGDWHWSMEGGQSVARFAGGAFILRCDPVNRTITLLRAGQGSGRVPVTIFTASGQRVLSGMAQDGPPPAIAASFPPHDKFLDAMAFSRGRFAVEVAGLPPLYVPSWPEVSRVIEDCR